VEDLDDLGRGREYDEQLAWADAHDALTRADRAVPLETDDVREPTDNRPHLSNIFVKIDLPSRAGATTYAHRHNLV
jgi:hypothetical protein